MKTNVIPPMTLRTRNTLKESFKQEYQVADCPDCNTGGSLIVKMIAHECRYCHHLDEKEVAERLFCKVCKSSFEWEDVALHVYGDENEAHKLLEEVE